MRLLLALLLSLALPCAPASVIVINPYAFASGVPPEPPAGPTGLSYLFHQTWTTNSTSYTSGSWTPPTGAVLLAFVGTNSTATPSAPTSFVGNNLTWVSIGSFAGGGVGQPRVTVYRTFSTAPTAGTMTVGFGATQSNNSIAVMSVVGATTTGTLGENAVVQIVGASSAGSADPSVTLAPIGGTGGHMVVGYVIDNVLANTDNAPESGWSELWEVMVDSPFTGHQLVYRTHTTDNTMTTTATSRIWTAVGIELQ